MRYWPLPLMGLGLAGLSVGLSGSMLKQIARLAVERLANSVESLESYAFDLARFQQRHIRLCEADAVRKLLGAHLPLCQHHIEVHDNRHAARLK